MNTKNYINSSLRNKMKKRFKIFLIVIIALIVAVFIVYLTMQSLFTKKFTKEFILSQVATSFDGIHLEVEEVEAVFPFWIYLTNVQLTYKDILFPKFEKVRVALTKQAYQTNLPIFSTQANSDLGEFEITTTSKKENLLDISIFGKEVDLSYIKSSNFEIYGTAEIALNYKSFEDFLDFGFSTDSVLFTTDSMTKIYLLENTEFQIEQVLKRDSPSFKVSLVSPATRLEISLPFIKTIAVNSALDFDAGANSFDNIWTKSRAQIYFRDVDIFMQKPFPYLVSQNLLLDSIFGDFAFGGNKVNISSILIASKEFNIDASGTLLKNSSLLQSPIAISGNLALTDNFFSMFRNAFILRLLLSDALVDDFAFKIDGTLQNPKFEKVGRLK